LHDALVVNPYDIAGVAEAVHAGLEMGAEEQRSRMRRMRRQVMEHNIYRWAASVLGDLRELRIDGVGGEGSAVRRPTVMVIPPAVVAAERMA
jgi:trehalose 6-phosphate synthase